MSATIDLAPELSGPNVPTKGSRTNLVRVLLACGVLYSLLFAVTNDVIAATLYHGYSRMSQAVSELSATSAPTRTFLIAVLPVSTALMIAFGIGVWKSARGKRALRVTGALIAVHGATFPLWLLAPMSSREDMLHGVVAANDVGHIILTAVTGLLIFSELGVGAVALGRRFRLYSLVTLAIVFVFGGLTAMESPKVPAGEPTPWMGLYERISIAAWLLWLAVLAILLLRRRVEPKVEVPDTPETLLSTSLPVHQVAPTGTWAQ